MNKPTFLMLMLGISSASFGASDDSSKVSSPDTVQALQKQIDDLQKQLVSISKKVNEQSKQVKEIKADTKQVKLQQQTAELEVPKEDAPVFDKGYMPVPGTKSALKVYGMVKLDTIYDGKNTNGDYTLMSNLPYNLQARNPGVVSSPAAYSWKKHLNMHAKQSLFGIKSVTKTSSGTDIKANIELDLLGGANFGDAYQTYTAGGMTAGGPGTLTYTPRLRFATITYGGLMVGHTWTNFYDQLETIMPTVDYGSLNGPGRRAQIRYTHTFDHFQAALAFEQPRADYVAYNNAPTGTPTPPNYVYYGQSTTGNLSKTQRPDITFSLKYKTDNGSSFGFAAIVRDLTIKNNNATAAAADGRIYKAKGYGFNFAAKIMTIGKSYVTGGYMFGKGIGWYIGDLNGRSAVFDVSNSSASSRSYKAIGMSMAWLGYTHVWNDQWQSNVGASQANLETTNFPKPTQWYDPGLDKQMTRLCFNTMYSPEENLNFGLEFMYLQRKSVLGYRGEGNRYQFGASYKF